MAARVGSAQDPPRRHKQRCISQRPSVRKWASNDPLRWDLSEVLTSLVFNENRFSDCMTQRARYHGHPPRFLPATFGGHQLPDLPPAAGRRPAREPRGRQRAEPRSGKQPQGVSTWKLRGNNG